MSAYTDEGIVLRLYDFSESSQIAALLTRRSGIIRVLAKGTRRATKAKASVGLDLLEFGDFSHLPARGSATLGTLFEWMQRDSFNGARRDLRRLYSGLYASEISTLLMEEGDPHETVFASLLTLLEQLGGGEDLMNPAAGVVRYQAELLKSAGFAPVLRECVDCGKPRERGTRAWFGSRAGGMLCADCHVRHAEKRPMNPALLDSPRGATRPEEWVELLNYHISMIAGRAVNSAIALLGLFQADAPIAV